MQITADWVLITIFEFLTGHEWKEFPRALGKVQTGMASFCKAPPTAEQLEQQQKFKQQVQKQRAEKQAGACSGGSQAQAQAVTPTQGRLWTARHSQQGHREAAEKRVPLSCAVLRLLCPCRLVWQALKICIERGADWCGQGKNNFFWGVQGLYSIEICE